MPNLDLDWALPNLDLDWTLPNLDLDWTLPNLVCIWIGHCGMGNQLYVLSISCKTRQGYKKNLGETKEKEKTNKAK